MNKRQEAFCVAFAKSGNATQAAIEAGYSTKTAREQGSRLLTNVNVQRRLQELAEETREQREKEYKKNIATAGEIQDFLTQVMRGELTEETIVVEGQGDGYSKARFLDKKPAFKDRVSAAEKLARMQGLFNDKISIDGNVPIVLVDDVGDEDE